MTNLLRAEILKITSTRWWWMLLPAVMAGTCCALLLFVLPAYWGLEPAPYTEGLAPEDLLRARGHDRADDHIAGYVANLYTAGKYVGLLVSMVVGVLLVTHERAHRTATSTYLATPRRARVAVAKLGAAGLVGAMFWLLTTLLCLLVAELNVEEVNVAAHIVHPVVNGAVSLNLMAFVAWSVGGTAIGTLIDGQAAAVSAGLVLYLAGALSGGAVFLPLADAFDAGWAHRLLVYLPGTASGLTSTGAELPGDSPPWMALVVLLCYTVFSGVVTVLGARRGDNA